MLCYTKLIPFLKDINMKRIILSVSLILVLIPFSQAFSQEYSDNAPTLSVSLSNDAPFVYRDSEGYTVVVGMVENNAPLTPVTNVRIQVNFFDEFTSAPLEVVGGNTILEVIPSDGTSPYAIRSQTPNPLITEASVSLLGFDSSIGKQKGLTVYSSNVILDNSFKFSGVLKNSGAPSSNTNVYLAFYDGFEPPRILGISTIELGDVESNAEVSFDLDEIINVESKGFLLFAESNIFYSDVIDVEIPIPQSLTKLVRISDVAITDVKGNKISELPVDSTVYIESKTWIQFAADQNTDETPYTYYVQIKNSETGAVEYLAKYDGRFIGSGTQLQTMDWIPENKGLFFIETFVWDRSHIPIADKGPFILIFVN